VISEVRNSQLIELTVSSKPEITMLQIDMPALDGTYAEMYDTGIVQNEKRNKLAVKITEQLLKDNHRVLLLVKRVKHGEILKKMFRAKGIYTAFCYGESSEEERDKSIGDIRSGKSNILILSKIGQLGIDLPLLTAGVFLSGGKSTVEVLQSLGRYLRNPNEGENTILFYDFYDMEEKYLKGHSEIRKEIYAREGFKSTVVSGRMV
jgi:superfamily II DNA or RNA helicase